ncbi:MAG: helix-turn-helix domain-containing protein [Sphingomonas sp.]|jgi:DNA-binding transcriptional regulator YdaS (Cro superfamily)|uniref:transcriptional regulator n=1 Tax=Sphingomonas TaxID=13687 RepID=UPI00036A7A85|nr:MULTISPECIES: YdaS family helix-turn-helix protein [Sphingomonas]MBI0530382.1 hypothetical protein [Sphingomonas sp. TX0522]MCP4027820.1 helix-turn-helix domain-containing protein [Sphingomonas sp.]
MSTATPQAALAAAVSKIGSQSGFARVCSVSQAAVWKWLERGKQLPAEHVLRVEQATGVSRHLLRPDIYPAPVAAASSPYGEATVEAGTPIHHCDRGAGLQVETDA